MRIGIRKEAINAVVKAQSTRRGRGEPILFSLIHVFLKLCHVDDACKERHFPETPASAAHC